MKVSYNGEDRDVISSLPETRGAAVKRKHHCPVLAGLADVDNEVLDDLLALG